MRKKVFFRADASPMIGYGHFIRSLALADMLKDDFDCTMVTQEPTESQKQMASAVCKLEEVPSDMSKLGLFLDMLTGDETVVLDNYSFDTEYQRQVKAKGCKLVCIDDMHDKHYVADVVINHLLTKKSLFSVERYTRLCLGPEWALLRRQFLSLPSHRKMEDKDNMTVMTVFGGADSLGLTDKAVELLKQMPGVNHIDAVVGFEKQTPDDSSGKVDYFRNLSADQMVNLYQYCDVALLPTSSVCLEALACGILVIGGFFVDNQKNACVQLVKDNQIVGIGDLRKNLTDKYLKSAFDLSLKTKRTKFDRSVFEAIPQKYVQLFGEL